MVRGGLAAGRGEGVITTASIFVTHGGQIQGSLQQCIDEPYKTGCYYYRITVVRGLFPGRTGRDDQKVIRRSSYLKQNQGIYRFRRVGNGGL